MDDHLTHFAYVEPLLPDIVEKRPLAHFGHKPEPPPDAPKPGKKGVSISADHHQQLVLLAKLPSLAGVSLGGLLDNILTVFFEDYAPEIQGELGTLQDKFPRPDTPPS